MGWDPAKQSDPNNISGANNELFTRRSGIDQAHSLEFATSGKIYFELKCADGNFYTVLGIQSEWGLSGGHPGDNHTNGVVNIGVNNHGHVLDNGSFILNAITEFGTGATIGFAVDIDQGELYISKNGLFEFGQDPANNNNPVAVFPAGLPVYAATGQDYSHNSVPDSVEIHYTNTYAAPAGYTPLLTPLIQYRVQGTITETSPITDWVVSVVDHFALPDAVVHTVETSGTSYILENLTTDNPVFVTLTPKIGKKWQASHYYSLNSLVIYIGVTGHAHLFRCTAAGNSGTTEPVWDTAQPVIDNQVTWGFVATLPKPRIQGPLIPELMP